MIKYKTTYSNIFKDEKVPWSEDFLKALKVNQQLNILLNCEIQYIKGIIDFYFHEHLLTRIRGESLPFEITREPTYKRAKKILDVRRMANNEFRRHIIKEYAKEYSMYREHCMSKGFLITFVEVDDNKYEPITQISKGEEK